MIENLQSQRLKVTKFLNQKMNLRNHKKINHKIKNAPRCLQSAFLDNNVRVLKIHFFCLTLRYQQNPYRKWLASNFLNFGI